MKRPRTATGSTTSEGLCVLFECAPWLCAIPTSWINGLLTLDEARGPAQLLHVILAAELEDNASWELLIDLAQEAGAHELIDAFDHAMRQEREHLSGVKALVADQARRELVEAPGQSEPLIPLI